MLSPPPPAARCARPGARLRSRGFTLIELMVTVVIIGLLAALATPGIMARVNSYKTRSLSEMIASTYRLARLRAMGRGAAVVVRYNEGTVTVLEGIQGADTTNAGCKNLPAPSCLMPADRFNSTDRSRTIESYATTADGTYTVSSSFGDLSDVCFTPMGRAYSRTDLSATFAPLLTPATFSVKHGSGGLVRQVLVLPNGTARVSAEGL